MYLDLFFYLLWILSFLGVTAALMRWSELRRPSLVKLALYKSEDTKKDLE